MNRGAHKMAESEHHKPEAEEESRNITDQETVVLPDSQSAGRRPRSTASFSIFSEEELAETDIDLTTDISLEFRRSLENRSTRYSVEKLLATGGFGQIFLAEDKILGRKIVIKSLKEGFLNDETAVARFIAEAKLSAQLEHPSIVPMYSLNSDSADGLHLAMQLIKGITLGEYIDRTLAMLKKKNISQAHFNKLLRERLEIFLHICDAIAYCHSRRIIHNDLKPENIMIADYGQVYIMDWGIASIDGRRKSSRISGSLSYMAPERLRSHLSNKQTDIFSLGMILNELVTLRGPVTGGNSDEVIRKICRSQFELSTCVIPRYHISRALRAIIEKARCPKPEERYYNVRPLAEDIRHFLFHEEVKAYPDTLIQKGARLLFHYRVQCLWIVLALIFTAGGVALFSYHRQNQVIRQMGEQMVQNLRRQNVIDMRAVEFGRRIILLQEQSRSICDTFSYEMKQPVTDSPLPVYTIEDYAPGSKKRIPGLVHTPFYQSPATLEHGTWYLFNKNLPPRTLKKFVQCFHALYSQRLSAMALNIDTADPGMRKDRRKIFYRSGSLIRRMIFSFDSGAVFTYPGMYEPAATQEDFLSEYIRREKRTGQQLLWAPPYIDKSGHPVIACWRTLYDPEGKNIGIFGCELSCFGLMKLIDDLAVEDKSGSYFAMVDTEDRLIYSSEHGKKWRESGSRVSMLRTLVADDSYHHPVVLRKIRKNHQNSPFDIVLGGKPYRIFWVRIPFANWLLIQHLPL